LLIHNKLFDLRIISTFDYELNYRLKLISLIYFFPHQPQDSFEIVTVVLITQATSNVLNYCTKFTVILKYVKYSKTIFI